MAELKITINPEDPEEGKKVSLTVMVGDSTAKAEDVNWKYGKSEADLADSLPEGIESNNPLTIGSVSSDHEGFYQATVGGDSVSTELKLTAKEAEPDPSEVGAFAQFSPQHLGFWSVGFLLLGVVLAFVLWLTADGMNLLTSKSEDGLANLVALWLLTFGSFAFLLGVVLQLAALRVAKIRPGAQDLSPTFGIRGVDLGGGTLKSVSDLAETAGELLKSMKVPVAAMFVGTVLIVMGGVIANTSLEDASTDQSVTEVCQSVDDLTELPESFEGLKDALTEVCN